MKAIPKTALRYSLALLPLAAACLMLPALFTAPSTQPAHIALLISMVLFAVYCWLAGALEDGLWAGYIHLSVSAIWLIHGLPGALWVVILGSTIAGWGWRTTLPDFNGARLLSEVAGRIALSGLSVLAAHGVYTLLNGQMPLQLIKLDDVLPLFLSLSSSYLVLLAVGGVLIGALPPMLRRNNRRLLPLEFLLMLVAVILGPLLYQTGVGTFTVVIGMVTFQALRTNQVSSARNALMRRVREMTTLYTLGQTLSNTLVLNEVLENLYREVGKLINATTLYIALYDTDRNVVEYPLVRQAGAFAPRAAHPLQNGPTDYIIRTRRYLLFNRTEQNRLALLEIDPAQLTDAAFLGVPLVVGHKVIGVLAVIHRDDPAAFKPSDVAIMETIASQASLAIRNATLYQRTVRVADNLSLINRSLQDVMFNLDQADSLASACTVAIQIASAHKAAIFLLDASGAHLKLAHSLHFAPDVDTALLIRPLQTQLYETGARTIVDTHLHTDPAIRQQGERLGYRACLEVPLRSGNAVVGFIGVYHDRPHHYEPPEISLLEMLANQITAALDNAELLQALELYAAEQAQLVHLSRITSAYLDLEHLLIDVCATLTQMLAVTAVEIGLFDGEAGQIKLYRTESHDQLVCDILPQDHIPEMYAALSERIMRMHAYPQPQGQSPALTEFMAARGIAMLTLAPTFINRQVTGFILLENAAARDFTDNDRRLIEMATNQVAAQLHNARVHMMTEEALVQRLQQLALIEDIAGQISRSLDPDRTITSVLDASLRSTGAEYVALALLDEHRETMTLITQEILTDSALLRRTHQRPASEGVIGYVVQTGEPILEGDNSVLPQYIGDASRLMRSSLAVPMMKGNTIIGVLDVESIKPNFFTIEQASYIRSLAGHAAISIDNARMLEDRQHQITTLTHLRELSLTISMLFEQPRIVQAVLTTALDILDGRAAVLYSYDPNTDEVVIMGNAGRTPADDYPAIPADIVYAVVNTQQPEFIEDVTTHPVFDDESEDTSSIKSLAAIPLMRRNAVHEILCITFNPAQRFTARLRNTIELLATQIAGHMENAALNEVIRASNNRMRAILDATRDGIILLDRAGRLQDANKAAAQLLGIDLQAHMRESFSRVLTNQFSNGTGSAGEAAILTLEHNYQNEDSTALREYAIPPLANRLQPLFIREVVLPVQDAEGRLNGSLLLLRDITEEKELAIYRDKLQDMVLHDLIKPLNAIISGTNVAMMILDDMGITNPEDYLRHSLQITLDSAWYLDTLARSLRDIPRLGKGEVNLHRQPVAVQKVAEDAFNLLAYSLKEANIQLEYQIDPQAAMIDIDVELIKRIFINLLHNAFKFTPQDGRVLIASDMQADKPGYVRIRINDTGPGVPENQRERIFEEFVQIETLKPQRGGKGSGVGLAFCRLAIEAHGGKIWVEPEGLLSGACFAFTLPRADAPAPPPPALTA